MTLNELRYQLHLTAWHTLYGGGPNSSDWPSEYVAAYRQAKGREPLYADIGHAIYAVHVEGKALDRVWGPPPANGLRHRWDRPTGAFLYSGPRDNTDDFTFIGAFRYFAMIDDLKDRYIAQQKACGATHLLVCACCGVHTDPYGAPFDGRLHHDELRAGLQRIIAADLAPIVIVADHEYIWQQLVERPLNLVELIEDIVPVVAPLASSIAASWELNELFRAWADHEGVPLDTMRRWFSEAIRRASPTIPIAFHNVPGEGIYRLEMHDFAPTIALLQTGFDASDEQMRRFIGEEKVRNDQYGCVTAVGEHSIPANPINSHAIPWAEAQRRGRVCLAAGAVADLSGAATTGWDR
jgi:hypothetical protein